MTETQNRPTRHNKTLASAICDQLAQGYPLPHVCRNAAMPGVQIVRAWMVQRPELAAAIAQATRDGYDAIAQDCRATARGTGDDGDIRRDKLIIDTDLKILSKWDPARYGDRLPVVSDNGDGLPNEFIVTGMGSDDATDN
ncbi:MAG: hypothetical protein RL367_311 [Pseudomonadota bacterium]